MKNIIIASLLASLTVLSFAANADPKIILCNKDVGTLSNQFAQSWHRDEVQQKWMSYVEDTMLRERFTGNMMTSNGNEPRDKNPHLVFLHAGVFETHGMHHITCHYRIANPEIESQKLIMSTTVTDTCRMLKHDVVICG